MSFQEEVRHFIVDNYLNGEDGGLSIDSSFLKEGIVDSTDVVQLTAFLEDQDLITIEDAELTPPGFHQKGCAFHRGEDAAYGDRSPALRKEFVMGVIATGRIK